MPSGSGLVFRRRNEGPAAYAADEARSRGRRRPERESAYRGLWQRDRDRLVHSTAFRRLEYKTQVFVAAAEGDHYRNRLTHTLEVAQIARTAARALGLNEDLEEALALGHDLGHGPFGHAGEEALTEAVATARGVPAERLADKEVRRGIFDHNVQGLRLVDELERTHPDFRGLNLTYETREGFAKNHVRAGRPGRPRAELGFSPDESPSLEVQLVGRADEIAYDSHDADDGLASGVLDEDALRSVTLWREVEAGVLKEHPRLRDDARLRRRAAVRRLIGLLVDDLLVETTRRLREQRVETFTDVRTFPGELVGFSAELTAKKKALERFLRHNFYSHPKVDKLRRKWRRRLKKLFFVYLEDPRLLPDDYHARATAGTGDGNTPERVVCDYLAGMTDRYAEQCLRRLCGRE